MAKINPISKRRGNECSDFIAQEEIFNNFRSLKSTVFDAIENTDLAVIDSCLQQWQELCESADSFLYEAVILMNPLAWAVARKSFIVIKHLVRHCNMRLQPFHSDSCKCRLCITIANDHRFLQLYIETVAVSAANPCYVFCAHPDTAIEITLTLRRHIERYKRLVGKNACQGVVNKCEETIVKALNIVSNEREAFELLQDVGDDSKSPVEARLGQILDFIDLNMKRAIEHSTVQSILEHEWTNGQSRYRGKLAFLFHDGILGTFLSGSFIYFILIPLIIVFPHPQLVRHLEKPMVRFQTHAISFIFFFVIALCTSLDTYLDIHLICMRRLGSSLLLRISIWQGVLGILIAAKILKTVTSIYFTGKRMIVSIYDILYVISINFTVLGTTLILIAVFIVPERMDVHEICQWILKIPQIEQLSINCTVTNHIYKQYSLATKVFASLSEPYVIGSVFVGASFLVYLVSFGTYLYNFEQVALFAITVQYLVFDVAKWVLFFLFFMFGWCFAFKTLYSNFPCNNIYFNSIGSILTELFWVTFAMSSTNDYELNMSAKQRSETWSTELVETIGYIIYLGFFIVGTLILLNLLIALMSVSYEKLEDNRRQEVYFWRSKMMIKFILWNDSLPLPWNLLFPVYILNRTLLKCALSSSWNISPFSRVAEDRILKENGQRSGEHLILKDRAGSVFHQYSDDVEDIVERL